MKIIKTKLKNIYDLEHQRLMNSSNIWHIVLATLTIAVVFYSFPDYLDRNIVFLIKLETIIGFIVAALILYLLVDSKVRDVENKIKEL